jgi:hypothetical protein
VQENQAQYYFGGKAHAGFFICLHPSKIAGLYKLPFAFGIT